MTTGNRIRLFLLREVEHSLRTRWFLTNAAVFMAGGVLLVVAGSSGTLLAGHRGYARALAGLAHFAILFVPIMALLPASASLAEERENGTLEYLLAQPVTWGQVFIGKWLGVSVAVVLALSLGYLASASVSVFRGVPSSLVLAIYAFLVLLSLVFVSLGTVFSALSDTRSRATAFGIGCWLVLVVLGSLGVLAAFIRWGAPAELLAAWSFFNPVEAFRIGVMTVLDPDLQLLGPVGTGLVRRHGPTAIALGSAFSLCLWILLPILGGRWAVSRRRDGV
ncbi:MAG: ABC transporter permease subunit [Candidatus Palauibacterales bacterium]|nr:ABC transporter permease subunit [Candidatus Palauibacterales bacterium]